MVNALEWETLERQARRPLLVKAYGLSKDRELAEDLVQEALISAYQKFSQFDATKGTFTAWVKGILHRKWLDLNKLRQADERPMTSVMDEDSDWLPGEPMFSTDAYAGRDPAEIAIENLDAESRAVRRMRKATMGEMLATLDICERIVARKLSGGATSAEIMSTFRLSVSEFQSIRRSIRAKLVAAFSGGYALVA